MTAVVSSDPAPLEIDDASLAQLVADLEYSAQQHGGAVMWRGINYRRGIGRFQLMPADSARDGRRIARMRIGGADLSAYERRACELLRARGLSVEQLSALDSRFEWGERAPISICKQ
jgi:hypothetical protein